EKETSTIWTASGATRRTGAGCASRSGCGNRFLPILVHGAKTTVFETPPAAPMRRGRTVGRMSYSARLPRRTTRRTPPAGAKEVEHDIRTGRGRSAAAHRLRAWRGVPGPGDPRRMPE